jgi:hypothetical protein
LPQRVHVVVLRAGGEGGRGCHGFLVVVVGNVYARNTTEEGGGPKAKNDDPTT